jgi:hypothetical protein
VLKDILLGALTTVIGAVALTFFNDLAKTQPRVATVGVGITVLIVVLSWVLNEISSLCFGHRDGNCTSTAYGKRHGRTRMRMAVLRSTTASRCTKSAALCGDRGIASP